MIGTELVSAFDAGGIERTRPWSVAALTAIESVRRKKNYVTWNRRGSRLSSGSGDGVVVAHFE